MRFMAAKLIAASLLGTLLFSATSFAGEFTTTHIPPTLFNPTEITLPGNVETANIVQYGACGPGKVYSLSFDDDEDALVTFDNDTPLPYPVHIAGGRNVIIRGLHIALETQPGNEIGVVSLSDQTYNQTNPHPIVPACGGLRLNARRSATLWIEGLHLDTRGHDADGIIINSDNNPVKSKVVIQNSLIEGIEGSMGLHGDILQTQNGHIKELILENVTMRQASEGIVLSFPVDHVELRNVDYATDTRFDSDDAWDDIVSGGFFADSQVDTFNLENVYIKYKNPANDRWFIIQGRHFTSPESAGTVIYGVTTESHPEVHFSMSPPLGNFALASQVGRNYVPAPRMDCK